MCKEDGELQFREACRWDEDAVVKKVLLNVHLFPEV